MFQICLCGAQPGYRHADDCPFPYYGRSEQLEARWAAERAAGRARTELAAAQPWTPEDILRNEG